MDYVYLRYADVPKKQQETVRQFCENGAWKMKVSHFEMQFPKVHQILTDGVRSSQRKSAAGERSS